MDYFHIVAEDIAKQIDYSKVEQVDGTFILDNLRKREADMIFKVPFLNEQKNPKGEFIIYIIIEHQSTVDQIMPF